MSEQEPESLSDGEVLGAPPGASEMFLLQEVDPDSLLGSATGDGLTFLQEAEPDTFKKSNDTNDFETKEHPEGHRDD